MKDYCMCSFLRIPALVSMTYLASFWARWVPSSLLINCLSLQPYIGTLPPLVENDDKQKLLQKHFKVDVIFYNLFPNNFHIL